MDDEIQQLMRRADVIYFPPPPTDPEAHATKRAMADDLRVVVEAVSSLDTDAAGPERLALASEAIAIARQALTSLPSLRDKPLEEWPHHEQGMAERGPLVGRANAAAPPLQLEHHDGVTRGWAIFSDLYEGAPDRLHGGVLAAAFDELLGCAQMMGTVMGATGTLTIRYRNPSPVGQRIDFEARIDRTEGRKAFLVGTAHLGDVLLAEAEGIFIASA